MAEVSGGAAGNAITTTDKRVGVWNTAVIPLVFHPISWHECVVERSFYDEFRSSRIKSGKKNVFAG